MYDLFTKARPTSTGTLRPPEYAFLERSLLRELQVVKKYYRTHYKQVSSNNLFANLINTLQLNDTMDDYRYSRFIEDQVDRVVRPFKITTEANKGWVHEKGIVLGPQCHETIVSVENEDTFLNVEDNWWDLKPVTFLYHTRTDINFPILNNTTKGKGFGSLAINIPMLAIKYRYWVKEMKKRSVDIPSVFFFVGTMVLPDLLDSYLDIAIFNRLDQKMAGIPTRQYPSPHPFYLTDYTSRVDRFNEQLIVLFQGKNYTCERLLYDTPLIVKTRLSELLSKPKGIINRNNEWVFVLRYIPFIRFMTQHYVNHGSSDQFYRNRIYTHLLSIKNDRQLSSIGSRETSEYYQSILEATVDKVQHK